MHRDGETGLPELGRGSLLLTEWGSSLLDFIYNPLLCHAVVNTLIFVKSVFHNETMLLALVHGRGEASGVGGPNCSVPKRRYCWGQLPAVRVLEHVRRQIPAPLQVS